jgi:hypothetical protein
MAAWDALLRRYAAIKDQGRRLRWFVLWLIARHSLHLWLSAVASALAESEAREEFSMGSDAYWTALGAAARKSGGGGAGHTCETADNAITARRVKPFAGASRCRSPRPH